MDSNQHGTLERRMTGPSENVAINVNERNDDDDKLFTNGSDNKYEFVNHKIDKSWRWRPDRTKRLRMVNKNGASNIKRKNISDKHRKYIADMFTTLVDLPWRWNLIFFAAGFLLSWLIFGIIWYIIPLVHEDFEHRDESNWTKCLENVDTFAGALLFSIESQHTIGYGFMYVTDDCPQAIITVGLQSLVGVILEAFLVGIIFAKLSKPTKRRETLLFSNKAVVCLRDGKLCLMFRIGDVRKSHIINAHVRALLVRQRVTREGEVLPCFKENFELQVDAQENVLLLWPLVVTHVIDSKSPFYRMSANDIRSKNFEILVLLSGCIESTGGNTEAKSSYIPSEILWGHRFKPLMQVDYDSGDCCVDYKNFHETLEVATPRCSALNLQHLKNNALNSSVRFQDTPGED